MRKETIAAIAAVLLTLIICVVPLFAADTYTPEPLRFYADRIAEHDKQICDLDERVKAIEDRLAEALAVKATSTGSSRSSWFSSPSSP